MTAAPASPLSALALAVLAGGVPLLVAVASNAASRSRVSGTVGIARADGGRASLAARLPRPALPAVVRPALEWMSASRERRRRADALLAALTLMAQQLRSGRSLAQAVEWAAQAAPPALAPDLHGVVHRARHGAGLHEGLRWWVEARAGAGDGDIRMAAACLGAAVESGGPAARVLDVVTEVVRDRRALAGETAALTAQARASAVVIGLAPVAMAALTALTDPAALAFLLTPGPGLVMLAAGLVLDALGVAWMTAMIRRQR